MTDRGLDEPVPDMLEQHREVTPDDEGFEAEDADLAAHVPLEADPADAADQARTVRLGEDDYR